jgi:hypothetical protein
MTLSVTSITVSSRAASNPFTKDIERSKITKSGLHLFAISMASFPNSSSFGRVSLVRLRRLSGLRYFSNLNDALRRVKGGSELVALSNRSKAVRQRMLGLVKHDVVRARYGHRNHETVALILNFAAELRSFALQFGDRV